MKIVLVVLGVFVFVTVAGMGTCVYIGYRAKQKFNEMAARAKQGGKVAPEVHLGTGGAGSEAAAEATKDVPPYPASAPTGEGGGLTFGTSGGVHSQEYETSDSVDQVVAFYKEKLGSKINVAQSEGNAELTYTTSNGMTTVTITRDESAGKTKITIARIGK
jgi:hypothetical protein